MGILTLSPPERIPKEVSIELVASKSISNRLLLMRALSGIDFPIHNLSKAEDTIRFQEVLKGLDQDTLQAGEGGTTFRFLTALLATLDRPLKLEASGPMQNRPVGTLVDGLNVLGANIEYLGNKGYPPLQFKGGQLKGGQLEVAAGESSQYVSALMMIAPKLKNGLKIRLKGPITSLSYIQMTAKLMEQMGVTVSIDLPIIEIKEQSYEPPKKGITVESDWSGASYFWAISSLLDVEKTSLKGLQEDSVQGDSIIADWAREQGFQVAFDQEGMQLIKSNTFNINWTHQLDLNSNPDLAQTVIALYASDSKHIEIEGLQTLFHKETDRLKSMKQELDKIDVPLQYDKNGNARLHAHPGLAANSQVVFDTYHDHRMAMALSILACKQQIQLRSPEVVNKSFPNYWDEFSKYGFSLIPPHPVTAP